jgi:hypothetical protein
MSTLITDRILLDPRTDLAPTPLTELGYRVVKQTRANYDGGQWNPDTNYNWVPGMFNDYTPLLANSRIRMTLMIPYVGLNAAHGISHWIFYANGVEQGRHGVSGEHVEDQRTYVWDVASWGTSSARIGYQMRAYANDNHEIRPYTTRYWDGGGSQQNCRGQYVIEEYLAQGV